MNLENQQQSSNSGAEYKKRVLDTVESSSNPGLKLERSSFFRYPKGAEIVRDMVAEKVKEDQKAELLEIGVGNMQELASFLAAVYQTAKENNLSLKDIIDTKIVELRDREEIKPRFSLGKQAGVFLAPEDKSGAKAIEPPKQWSEGFNYDAEKEEYFFTDEVQGYINEIVGDSDQHFSTPVEEYLDNSEGDFDIVVANNVLQYLGVGSEPYDNPINSSKGDIDTERFQNEIKKILNRVRLGGVLIMHVDKKGGDKKGKGAEKFLESMPEFTDRFEKIEFGTYRRIK